MHHRVLWILQWLVGIYFVAIGIMHFVVPEGLPGTLSWMYDLDDTLHLVTGVAEILAGIGLILPTVTRVLPMLTPLAATGLVIVMVGAVVFHLGREEYVNIVVNVILVGVLAYIAYGRWRLAPIEGRAG